LEILFTIVSMRLGAIASLFRPLARGFHHVPAKERISRWFATDAAATRKASAPVNDIPALVKQYDNDGE
jgi:hypothetical protein